MQAIFVRLGCYKPIIPPLQGFRHRFRGHCCMALRFDPRDLCSIRIANSPSIIQARPTAPYYSLLDVCRRESQPANLPVVVKSRIDYHDFPPSPLVSRQRPA